MVNAIWLNQFANKNKNISPKKLNYTTTNTFFESIFPTTTFAKYTINAMLSPVITTRYPTATHCNLNYINLELIA